METPRSYAAHLATYIASPLKIEKLVALEFDDVPPLHEIAEFRYRVEQQSKRFKRLSEVGLAEVAEPESSFTDPDECGNNPRLFTMDQEF